MAAEPIAEARAAPVGLSSQTPLDRFARIGLWALPEKT